MSVDTTTTAPATAAEQFALRRQSPLQRVQHLLHSHPALSPLMVLVVACIAFTIINPRFAQPGTISIILQQTAVIAALAIGQTLVILTAGIDLAVGAISILSMLLMANLVGQQRGARRPGPADRHRVRHDLRPAQRAAGHPAEPAAVHRHPRHAQHLHRHRPALLRRRQRGQGARCRRC